MLIYVIRRHSHDDDMKRASSDSATIKVYQCENDAYDEAIKLFLSDIDYGRYEFDITDLIQGTLKKKDIQEDISDFDRSILTTLIPKFKSAQNSKEKYKILLNNFEFIYGEAEFTQLPSHDFYYVDTVELIAFSEKAIPNT